jgi:putative transposase
MIPVLSARSIRRPMRNRRSIRLPCYDYRQSGWYYVTICTQSRACLLGEVVDGAVRLSAAGRIVYNHIRALPRHFERLRVDAFVVMPNHVHIVLGLADVDGGGRDGPAGRRRARRGEASVPFGSGEPAIVAPARGCVLPVLTDASPLPAPGQPCGTAPGSVGAIIQNLKSVSTRRINRLDRLPGRRVWQRNYWERVVRDEAELDRIRRYVTENPLHWEKDDLFPHVL